MSGFDIIKKTIDDHTELMQFLAGQGEVSYLTAVEAALPKVVLLSAASDLEAKIQDLIIALFERSTTSHEFAVSFVKNKAVSRQFHTYFNWKDRSANQFFALFGQRFKSKILAECNEDSDLKDAVKSFCEVGALRNELVHTNYATYTLNLTAVEVFVMYEKAIYFIDRLTEMLNDS